MDGYTVELYHVLWILLWGSQQESMKAEINLGQNMLTRKVDMLNIVCIGYECCYILASLPT